MRLISVAMGGVCLVLLGGCGGPGRAEVEGTVAYGGRPIPAGAIAFVTAEDQGRSGGGTILDGRYQVPPGVGLRPGKYKVEIRWARPTGTQVRSETGATLQMTREGLPAKYNDASELTAELRQGQNTLDFELPN